MQIPHEPHRAQHIVAQHHAARPAPRVATTPRCVMPTGCSRRFGTMPHAGASGDRVREAQAVRGERIGVLDRFLRRRSSWMHRRGGRQCARKERVAAAEVLQRGERPGPGLESGVVDDAGELDGGAGERRWLQRLSRRWVRLSRPGRGAVWCTKRRGRTNAGHRGHSARIASDAFAQR
ncbi:hypothetical protein EVG20_g9007 [Dentipellis fragilis]|uniref:Uncharacterized protein n=1 Tax=Dentipellis fragilis TaxID=205917 RepID=A0A4Y9Y3U2_9AGAM|nr:hypothetical protein EVG20_g9007 [Dentipellis fragilis]